MNKLVTAGSVVGIIALIIGVAIGSQILTRPEAPTSITTITFTTSASATQTMVRTTTTQTLIENSSVTLTVSNIFTTSCSSTFNSITCYSPADTSCQFISDAGPMYIRVLNDSGAPIKGASLSAIYNEPFCPGITMLTTSRSYLITNASGGTFDNWDLIGNYTYYINNDFKHPINLFLTYNMSTYLTVRIPSYNITTLYKPN